MGMKINGKSAGMFSTAQLRAQIEKEPRGRVRHRIARELRSREARIAAQQRLTPQVSACPRCGATGQDRCRTPSGRALKENHIGRA